MYSEVDLDMVKKARLYHDYGPSGIEDDKDNTGDFHKIKKKMKEMAALGEDGEEDVIDKYK